MKHSIMIVEDEKIVREGLVRTLSNNFVTFQASNIVEAVDILNDHHEIRVVVSDIKFSEEEAQKVLDTIHSKDKKIKVIFLTAFSSIESAVEAIRKGAYDYITKPVDLRKLQTSIKNAIDSDSASEWQKPKKEEV